MIRSPSPDQWMQPRHFHEKEILRISQSFRHQHPFPHIVLPHFLQLFRAEALRSALLQESFSEKTSDLFSIHQTEDLHGSTQQAIREIIALFESPAFRAFLKQITGKIVAPSIDIFGSNYWPTNYLLPHNDLVEGRVLAFSYYLTPGLTARDGGSLQFFSTNEDHIPQHVVCSYPALFNSLILFAVSSDSFHQVAEVGGDKDRLALSGWFRG